VTTGKSFELWGIAAVGCPKLGSLNRTVLDSDNLLVASICPTLHIPAAMAYIECPQCGQKALAVATRCPRCSYGFVQHRMTRGERHVVRKHRVPVWIGGGVVVLAVVFLAVRGNEGSGRITVPPVSSGLEQAPPVVAARPDSASTALATTADDTAVSTVVEIDSSDPGPLDTAPLMVATNPRAPDQSRPVSGEFRYAQTWVNVRAGRSGTAEAVRILDPGEQVEVDSLRRGWYRISIDGRPVGYVDRSLLGPVQPSPNDGGSEGQ
jgi:hypothetical protein